jgi:hypothetical protein
MYAALVHCPAGCGERLCDDLAAKDLRRANIATLAAKEVALEPLEGEYTDEIGQQRVRARAGSTRSRDALAVSRAQG